MIYGNWTCDHVTGEYVCRAGYIGLTCEHPCPVGTYGLNCLEKCTCKNGADCHHVTGACQCLPGWTGKNCSIACPVGTYGMNCSQHCKCLNGGKCRRNDGLCRCPPGWIGAQCTEICPEGYYGDHCMMPCECPNENFLCHAKDGCVCRQGFTGEHCDTLQYSKNVQEKEGQNYGSMAAGVIVALILVAIIVALLFYYKRRVANLKTEIAHVQYIADPQVAPDRHHFDNPVYSYQTSATKGDDGTNLLLNNVQKIRNDLGASKNNTNLERQKLGTGCSEDDDDISFKGAYGLTYDHPTSTKNREADAGNPNVNVYHSIEDLQDDRKVEHLYDEIKQKEGQDLEYDHLDYTRPGTSWKPHYQRMANGFEPHSKDTTSKDHIDSAD